MLRRPKKGNAPATDVEVGSPAEIGQGIVQCLKMKGFCMLTKYIKPDVAEKALADARRLDKEECLKPPASMIQEGLLGPDGSTMIFEMPLPGEDKPPAGKGLEALDEEMSTIASYMKPFQREVGIGFEISSRSAGVVHASGSAVDDLDPTDHEVERWMSIFARQKVAMLAFIGPGSGSMELRPYDEEALETEITVEPGMLMLIRTDLLSYKFFPRGHKTMYTLSCSLLMDCILTMHDEAQKKHWTPIIHELAEWMEKRLMELKQKFAEDETALDTSVPQTFITAMNHNYSDRAQTIVRGISSRQPTTWNETDFFCAQTAGPDLVVEVPIVRWDHSEIYDENPSVDGNKLTTSCKHAAFMEGVDLFDAKFFGLSAAEVKTMDPNQRQVLECCYDSLFRAGLRKKDLLGSSCGVYVGTASTDWNFADRVADLGVFGATGSAPSITAGRISFTLGLKGCCTAIDTDAASSLTCCYHACESVAKKGQGVIQPFACALGVHTILAKVWWPFQTAAGFLAPAGRCLTFDSSAQGWVRAENCTSIVVHSTPHTIDGEEVVDDQPRDGLISGAGMNSNGFSAGLLSASGPAEQEVMYQMIKMAGITPSDVDGIETHGAGQLLSDAVEVTSIRRELRHDVHSEAPLIFTSLKSCVGNGIEGAGLSSLVRVFQTLKYNIIPPSLHLKQLNPYIAPEDSSNLVNECLGYRLSSAFVASCAKGMGGTNVAMLCFGETDATLRPPRPELPAEKMPQLSFWPAGGGTLGSTARPKQGFSIVGTFNSWADAVAMENEGDGCYSYTLTLGENRWEGFQLRMDGNPMLVMHPQSYAAAKGSTVHGPSTAEEAQDSWWLLNGRTEAVGQEGAEAGEGSLVEYKTPDQGRAGDKYRISLHIAGKYRTVNWTKLADSGKAPPPVVPSTAEYYVTASWNGWSMEKMTPEPTSPGSFKLEVALKRVGGEFRIVRNKDLHQVIYPVGRQQPAGAAIAGPHDLLEPGSWLVVGSMGSKCVIKFKRVTENGVDKMTVSWQ